MSLFNHCIDCGRRIPWRQRAYFGNAYKPVVCTDCSASRSVAVYGSLEAANAAYERAIVEELARP